MKYEEALRRWGAGKARVEDWENIEVDFDMDPGYACCGGRDEGCYCSFAESASLNVNVYHTKLVNKYNKKRVVYTDNLNYDMTTFLRELFEVSA